MRRRIFVAINLDSQTIKAIEGLENECGRKMPAAIMRGIRFAPPSNWHITLSFLGYQDDDAVARITQALKETVNQFGAQEIVLEKLLYGPPGRTPRMIWIAANKTASANLGNIKTFFEDKLDKSGVNFGRETRRFNAHITLARFSKDMEMGIELPQIDRSINLEFEAKSLDLMESELKRGGAEYTALQKFPLCR